MISGVLMSRIASSTMIGLVLVLSISGCSGVPNPFAVTIHNDGGSILFLSGDAQPEPEVYVDWKGDWAITGGTGENGCYRPCGEIGVNVCPNLSPDLSTYALLPGDSAIFESPGEAFQPRRDASGECRGDAALSGPIRIVLCFGDEAWSIQTSVPLQPTESGSAGDAVFEMDDCATVEFDLSDRDEITLPLP
jgi:hypothetical protein